MAIQTSKAVSSLQQAVSQLPTADTQLGQGAYGFSS
jgi:hypothetical protein